VSQTILLQVSTNLSELINVLTWFEKLPHSSVPNADWLRCKTALAEIFTNTVRHAHRDMPTETIIDLEATISENMIEIKVFDYGLGFDLSKKLSTLDAVDIYALGGRGLDLINQMADVFTYNKTPDGRNCMLISKSYISVA
jgi:serine/threonine-protein kinase RsbW